MHARHARSRGAGRDRAVRTGGSRFEDLFLGILRSRRSTPSCRAPARTRCWLRACTSTAVCAPRSSTRTSAATRSGSPRMPSRATTRFMPRSRGGTSRDAPRALLRWRSCSHGWAGMFRESFCIAVPATRRKSSSRFRCRARRRRPRRDSPPAKRGRPGAKLLPRGGRRGSPGWRTGSRRRHPTSAGNWLWSSESRSLSGRRRCGAPRRSSATPRSCASRTDAAIPAPGTAAYLLASSPPSLPGIIRSRSRGARSRPHWFSATRSCGSRRPRARASRGALSRWPGTPAFPKGSWVS